MTTTERQYDLVLFGATGFTGRLTAEYLAAHAPAGLRWAVAGRDAAKLASISAHLADLTEGSNPVGIIRADVTDAASMAALARTSPLVASTVGPFAEYGEPLVAACADHGTDYVDITGEPEFVDRMWLAHQARAAETRARLVHCCGFDSIPSDLGAWWTLRHLPTGVPIQMRGYVRAHGTFSAGTYHSAVRAFGRATQSRRVAGERRALEGRPPDRRVGGLPRLPHREPGKGRWALPLPTIDPIVVRRSARALPEYGPAFRYGHFAVVGGLPAAVATTAGVGGVFALAQLPPTREALLRWRRAGDGPSEEQRGEAWFSVRFVAKAGDTEIVTEVSGGDPGYTETAMMLAESALCLRYDELPDTAGQVTTAQAMGQPLVDRLQSAGITFRWLS